MSWRFEGRLTVVVHGPPDPSNLEWQSLLTGIATRGQRARGPRLVVSYGGGPDSEQREQLAEQMTANPSPICVMTKSVIVRGMAAALLFFNRNMKVFGLEERKAAYDFLDLTGQEREAADRLRRELEQELGLPPISSAR